MSQFARFILVGFLNTGLGYAIIFACMYVLNFSAVVSNIAGYFFGLIISYTLNRRFTFRSTAQSRPEIVRFLAVFLVSYLANLAVLLLMIRQFGMHEGTSQLLAGAVYVVASFVMNKYYVFRHSLPGSA